MTIFCNKKCWCETEHPDEIIYQSFMKSKRNFGISIEEQMGSLIMRVMQSGEVRTYSLPLCNRWVREPNLQHEVSELMKMWKADDINKIIADKEKTMKELADSIENLKKLKGV